MCCCSLAASLRDCDPNFERLAFGVSFKRSVEFVLTALSVETRKSFSDSDYDSMTMTSLGMKEY